MILGVDGGGTKTVAALARASGEVLGRGRSGPSNYQVVGLDAAVESIRAAVRGALAGTSKSEAFSRAVFGLAGADFPRDRLRLTAALGGLEELAGVPLEVRNDAETALVGAVGSPRGVAVCAGTGAIVVGMDGVDRVERADGWGYLLGDEGSGYWIGLEALRVVVRRHDRRARLGRALERAVLEHVGISDATELLDWAYRSPVSVCGVAEIAPVVLGAASAGDAAARAIVRAAGLRLGHAACLVIRRLGFSREVFPLVALGGLLRSPDGETLRQTVEDAIRRAAPSAVWGTPLLPAEFGAVLLGGILDGVASRDFVQHLCGGSGGGPAGRGS